MTNGQCTGNGRDRWQWVHRHGGGGTVNRRAGSAGDYSSVISSSCKICGCIGTGCCSGNIVEGAVVGGGLPLNGTGIAIKCKLRAVGSGTNSGTTRNGSSHRTGTYRNGGHCAGGRGAGATGNDSPVVFRSREVQRRIGSGSLSGDVAEVCIVGGNLPLNGSGVAA